MYLVSLGFDDGILRSTLRTAALFEQFGLAAGSVDLYTWNGPYNNMDQETLFGDRGWATRFYEEVRPDLCIMFDVGWDTPAGIAIEQERWRLGSLEADRERFPDCTGGPPQRPACLDRMCRDAGWRGAAILVAPQFAGREEPEALDEHRAYWQERARALEILSFADVFRTYDVTAHLSMATTVDRAAELLAGAPHAPTGRALLNAEDEVYLVAALGCALCVMRHGVWRGHEINYDPQAWRHSLDEVTRAVRWQRLAPGGLPFVVAARTLFFNQLCHFSQPVREVSTRGAHIPMVQQLMGPNLALEWNQFVTKFPDVGSGQSEFPWHQDDGYGTLLPLGTLTVWVALVDVNEQNGCSWVVPGSHKHGLLEHGQKEEGHWFKEVQVEGNGIPAVLKAGEALAFSGLTLHRSLLNQSAQPRYAFFMRYCPPETIRVTAGNQSVLEYGHAWMVAGEAPLT